MMNSSKTQLDKIINNLVKAKTKTNKIEDISWFPYIPKGHTSFSWNVPDDDFKIYQKVINIPRQQKKIKSNTSKKIVETKTIKQPVFSYLDIRVGQIKECILHPNADKMYLEKIDIGESEPRQIISGLAKYIPISSMLGTKLLVVANLKPIKLRGIESFGMVLAASNSIKTKVELVKPPSNSKVGEKILLKGIDFGDFIPEKVVNANPKKKNSAWNIVKSKLKINSKCVACYDDIALVCSNGEECKVDSLSNCNFG